MFPGEVPPRKSSFLIRDILPDSENDQVPVVVDNESSSNRVIINRPLSSRSPNLPPHSRASSLELLHAAAIRPTAWDARFLTALNGATDHHLISPGGGRTSIGQIGRVVSSCGSVCCVVCSSGWPATSLNSDVLNHSRVLGGHRGTPPTLLTPVSLSWNCLSSNSLPIFTNTDRNREELSESPLSSQLSLSSEGNEKPNCKDSTTPSNSTSCVSHAPSGVNSSSGSGSVTRKVRRNRTVFTELQLMGLERRFDSQKYLSTPDRAELARALGLTQLQVKTWYQNRRMKWKKQVMQGGCTVPPTKPKGRPKKNSIPSMSECELNNLNNLNALNKPSPFLHVVGNGSDKPVDFLPTSVPCPFPSSISESIV